jgi:hypothetical protein
MDNPADLINVAIDELIHQRYELPGFNTLDRLVRRVRNLVNQKLFSLVLSQLHQEYIQRLDNLLDSHPVQRRSPYNDLKQLPKRPTRNHLNDLLTHLIWLDSLGEVKPYLDSLTSAKIQHFAAEAKALDAAELKEIGQNKRITLLLCLIYSAQVQARDNLVSMFLKRMRTIHNKSKEELERLRQKHLETTEKLVGVLTNVLQVFVDEPTDTQVIAQVQNIFTPAGGTQQLLNECEAVNAYSGNNYLPLIWRFDKSHRSVFFRLISALKFSSTSQDETLITETSYQHIDSLFKDSIDWSRIATHWNDLLRVVLSIQTGKISSSILLRKLGNYSRKNRLYQAFQELGRVVRTVFLLQYISDMQLRQQITAVTNKVEAYHGFAKWFFFGGEGVIANNDPEEQEKIIKYNDLIANAVVFHNAVDLTSVLRQLKCEGYLVMREDVAALSPYMTSQIKRFGDYLIDLDAVPQALDEEMTLTF